MENIDTDAERRARFRHSRPLANRGSVREFYPFHVEYDPIIGTMGEKEVGSGHFKDLASVQLLKSL